MFIVIKLATARSDHANVDSRLLLPESPEDVDGHLVPTSWGAESMIGKE